MPSYHLNTLLAHSHIAALIGKRMDSQLSVHGLSFTEFVILHQLDQGAGPLTRIALADAVGLTASGVTRLLAPMEKNLLIEKISNPRDARQSMVTLTDSGAELYQHAKATVELGCTNLFALLSEQELITLFDLLNKIKC